MSKGKDATPVHFESTMRELRGGLSIESTRTLSSASEELVASGPAAKLRSSQSRVAKMEAGDSSVSLDLLIRSLITLGASDRELCKIIATPRAA